MARGLLGKRKDIALLSESSSKGSIPICTGFNLSPHSHWKQVIRKDKVQVKMLKPFFIKQFIFYFRI